MKLLFTFLSLFVLLIPAAHATTYQEDFDLDMNLPTELDDDQIVMIRQNWDTNYSASDTDDDSDWSYIRCGLKGGDVWAQFVAQVDEWPTSFPETVTCTGGGHTLELTLVQDNSKNVDYDPHTAPGAGYLLELGSDDTENYRRYTLPASDYRVERRIARTAPRTIWAGVYCDLKASGTGHVLYITVSQTADADEGYCKLRRTGTGPNYHVDIEVTR